MGSPFIARVCNGVSPGASGLKKQTPSRRFSRAEDQTKDVSAAVSWPKRISNDPNAHDRLRSSTLTGMKHLLDTPVPSLKFNEQLSFVGKPGQVRGGDHQASKQVQELSVFSSRFLEGKFTSNIKHHKVITAVTGP